MNDLQPTKKILVRDSYLKQSELAHNWSIIGILVIPLVPVEGDTFRRRSLSMLR
jgi:hypothetical protein